MHERKLLHGLEGYFYLLTDIFYMFPFLSLSALPFFEAPIYQSKLSSEYVTHRPHRFTSQSFCFSAG